MSNRQEELIEMGKHLASFIDKTDRFVRKGGSKLVSTGKRIQYDCTYDWGRFVAYQMFAPTWNETSKLLCVRNFMNSNEALCLYGRIAEVTDIYEEDFENIIKCQLPSGIHREMDGDRIKSITVYTQRQSDGIFLRFMRKDEPSILKKTYIRIYDKTFSLIRLFRIGGKIYYADGEGRKTFVDNIIANENVFKTEKMQNFFSVYYEMNENLQINAFQQDVGNFIYNSFDDNSRKAKNSIAAPKANRTSNKGANWKKSCASFSKSNRNSKQKTSLKEQLFPDNSFLEKSTNHNMSYTKNKKHNKKKKQIAEYNPFHIDWDFDWD